VEKIESIIVLKNAHIHQRTTEKNDIKDSNRHTVPRLPVRPKRTISLMSTEIESSTPSNTKEFSLNPSEYDESRVVIHDPVTNTFNIGDAPVQNTTSEGRYLDENGVECELYFPAPPQTCFGVNYIYEMNLKKEQQIPENAKGLQVCYPVTSLKTVKNPTPQEKAFIDMIESLWTLAVDKGRQEAAREESLSLIPAPSVASCMAAEKQKKMERFVKPPMEFPKDKDKKSLDTTKPKRMYVKLVTSGKGPTLKAQTKFFGPGDEQKSPLRYVEARGIIEPCFKWEGIYWGSHGPTAPHGASLRFKLVEANYTPQANASVPSRRMLSKNSAPVQEEDDDFSVANLPRSASSVEDGGEAEGFSEPGSDDSNPAKVVEGAAKKNTAKPAVRVAAKPVVKTTPKVVAAKAPAKAIPAVKSVARPAAKPLAKPVVRKAAPPPPPAEEEVVETEEEVVEDE